MDEQIRNESHIFVFQLVCNQELRQNEIIDRLKAFSLVPNPGTVMEVSAGESRPLVVTYSADSLSYGGIHDLPVLASTTVMEDFEALSIPLLCRSFCFLG